MDDYAVATEEEEGALISNNFVHNRFGTSDDKRRKRPLTRTAWKQQRRERLWRKGESERQCSTSELTLFVAESSHRGSCKSMPPLHCFIFNLIIPTVGSYRTVTPSVNVSGLVRLGQRTSMCSVSIGKCYSAFLIHGRLDAWAGRTNSGRKRD